VKAALDARRSHALLLRAAPGIGALHAALVLAQSRLCDAPAAGGGLACGQCASCRLVQAHGHPDLFVLLPETLRREHGWPLPDDRPDAEEGKRKASRQIRIDDVRAMLDWVTKTAARGRGKVVVLHPVEALNDHAASALLKTMEEPPALTSLVLTCSDPHAVLPTVRSRCQQLVMPLPGAEAAGRWLEEQGVQAPQVLLAAAGGEPLAALQWHAAGIDAAAWAALPKALAARRPGALAGLAVPQMVRTLAKVCHDAMCVAAGGPTRFFAIADLPRGASLQALAQWSRELAELAPDAEHPWHEALALDALVARAWRALGGAPPGR
jgi:DNA polymerase-3 subunit delta'